MEEPESGGLSEREAVEEEGEAAVTEGIQDGNDGDDGHMMIEKAPKEEKKGSKGMLSILKEHWWLLFTAGTFSHLIQVIRSSRDVIIPLKAQDHGLSADQMGYVVAAGFFVDSVAFPLAGILMDGYGRKYAGIPSTLIMGMGFLALGLNTGLLTALIIATAVIGAGNGLSSGVNLTLGADLAPIECRGEFIGLYRLVTNLGNFVGPLMVGAIALRSSTSLASFVIAFSGLLAALWMLFMLEETLHPPEEPDSTEFHPLEEDAGQEQAADENLELDVEVLTEPATDEGP